MHFLNTYHYSWSRKLMLQQATTNTQTTKPKMLDRVSILLTHRFFTKSFHNSINQPKKMLAWVSMHISELEKNFCLNSLINQTGSSVQIQAAESTAWRLHRWPKAHLRSSPRFIHERHRGEAWNLSSPRVRSACQTLYTLTHPANINWHLLRNN